MRSDDFEPCSRFAHGESVRDEGVSLSGAGTERPGRPPLWVGTEHSATTARAIGIRNELSATASSGAVKAQAATH